jgi:3-methyladenine DNA glycosylase AlkD
VPTHEVTIKRLDFKINSMNFIEELELELRKKASPNDAVAMEKYMKNNFSFLGIKTEARRAIFKNVYEGHKQEIKSNFRALILDLLNKKEREFHYCALDLSLKEFRKNFAPEDIHLIEKFITTHSWWDTVDALAKFLVGGYLKQYPEKTFSIIDLYSNADSMWLNRTAILFQLSYKEKTNFDLLKAECEKHKNSTEFFIQKAIGWALRDYSRYNPEGVLNYVNSTNLKPLSQREATRNIKKS